MCYQQGVLTDIRYSIATNANGGQEDTQAVVVGVLVNLDSLLTLVGRRLNVSAEVALVRF
jgi:hypothetical protein